MDRCGISVVALSAWLAGGFSDPSAAARDEPVRSASVGLGVAWVEAGARPGGELVLPLFDGESVHLAVEAVERRETGVSLRGRVLGDDFGGFALTLEGGELCAGVWTSRGAYGLSPAGAEGTVLTEWAPSEGPDCLGGLGGMRPAPREARPAEPAGLSAGPGMPDGPGGPGPGEGRAAVCTDDPGTVDVLVVYTPAAVAAAGGPAALLARVQNTLDSTTLVFGNSRIPDLAMHLAGFREVAYDESAPDWLDHLVRVSEPADGYMDGVHGWRDDDRADCVMLIVDDTRFTGGAAWWGIWDEGAAFSCLNWRSAGGGVLTGPHEFGHNFGCAHDHENDVSAPYSYCWGHFYDNGPDTYGTVMSYVGVTLPYFSNPTLTGPGGQALGVPPGEAGAAYNALMVSQSRTVLANYRQSLRLADCNNNGVDDGADIAGGASEDTNGDGVPDECQARVFVDGDPHTEGDGLSWETSRRDLGEVLAVSNLTCAAVREIWAADGVYTPDSGTGDRWSRFPMRSGLGLYGGFEGLSRAGGGETELGQRDVAANETVLSGDLGVGGDPADNCYTIVEALETDSTAVLDGFTVRDAANDGYGGGIYGYRTGLRVRGCRIENNRAYSGAGAMFYEDCDVLFQGCVFAGNSAEYAGGGLGLLGSAARVEGCAFVSNAAGWYGGGMDAFESEIVVSNSWFWDNRVDLDGAGMSLGDSAAVVTGCSFARNQAQGYGGGINEATTALQVRNSVLWGNTSQGNAMEDQLNAFGGLVTVDYSLVSGWNGSFGGTGTIGGDPLFVDAFGGDLALSAGSPAIDAGSNPLVADDAGDLDGDGDTAEATPRDAGGAARFADDPGTPDTGVPGQGYAEVVDMGALEFAPDACPADFNGDGLVNTIDVLHFLNAWSSGDPRGDFNGDGSINTIDVIRFLNAWSAGC
ncbi:MAG: right-handed parallel beta-helix repeat-containing protein [Phycisphaerales bacterium]|nr:right-handed parallel beta-helix repeat-containing protein [Phycisphaerales bacterium]